jgi:hypothetical protein
MWRAAEGEYRVDYNKSVVEVCRDFVAFAVNKTGSLDIICQPWAPAAYRRQLPSWIATLADREIQDRVQADALVGLAGTNKKPYNASRRYPVAYSFGDQSIGSLFVDGCTLDSIKETGPIARIGVPTKRRELGSWNGGSPPPERFWRTRTGNRGQGASNPSHYFQRACAFFFASKRTIDD